MLRRTRMGLSGLGLALAACDTVPDDPTGPTASSTRAEAAVVALANTWATKTSIAPRLHAVAGTLDGVVYVVGGENPTYIINKVRAYTIATESWSIPASLPGHRAFADGATALGGRLYVSGGINNFYTPTKTLYSYNPGTNAWVERHRMPFAGACGAQGAIDGQLYVYTGQGGFCGSLDRFSRYDPATDSWTTLAPPPTVHNSAVAGVINGKFYLAGGSIDGPEPERDVEADQPLHANLALHIYNPATNSWTTGTPLPSARQYSAGGSLGGKLYVAGGVDFSSPNMPAIGTVRVFDPATNSWTVRAPMPTPRYHAVAAIGGGKLWIISGWTTTWSSKNEAYTP